MKKILLFGAGKSATVLIEYFLNNAINENWFLTLVDADYELAKHKIGHSTSGKAISFDINNELERSDIIKKADIVISLLPPALHLLIAKDCITYKKNLLTASYVDDNMKALEKDIEENNLLFLCEMGLDPGIDHMSAMKLLNEIKESGGEITSFHSHCGGLVAPESDDNPWHYKISWNPKNVVNAGKAGAIFMKDSEVCEMAYEELFNEKRFIDIRDHELLCWYPNRDSLSYIDIYNLHNCSTFIRTTLRHADFIYGWKNIIELKLTNEEKNIETEGFSLKEFFKDYFEKNGFDDWLQQKLNEKLSYGKKIMEELVKIVEMEKNIVEEGKEPIEEFMVVAENGELKDVNLDNLKTNIAASLAFKMHEANLTLKQLMFLGMDDDKTIIQKGKFSPADILQFALEKKLALQATDKDMVVMIHEIEFEKEQKTYKATSSLVVKGIDNEHTAMAKTVGLPLAIATKLILNNTIQLKGLHIPVIKEIYDPVLQELEENDIIFKEEINQL